MQIPFGAQGAQDAVEIEVDPKNGCVIVRGSPKVLVETGVWHTIHGEPAIPCGVLVNSMCRGTLDVSVRHKAERLCSKVPTLRLRHRQPAVGSVLKSGIVVEVCKSDGSAVEGEQLLFWAYEAPAKKKAA